MWKQQYSFLPRMNVGLGNSPLAYGPALNFFPVLCETFQEPFFFKTLEAVARRWLFAWRTDLRLLRGGRVCPLEGGKLNKAPCSCWVWVPVTSKEWPACGSAATKLLAISPYRLPGWSEACHYVVHSISGSVLNRFAMWKREQIDMMIESF